MEARWNPNPPLPMQKIIYTQCWIEGFRRLHQTVDLKPLIREPSCSVNIGAPSPTPYVITTCNVFIDICCIYLKTSSRSIHQSNPLKLKLGKFITNHINHLELAQLPCIDLSYPLTSATFWGWLAIYFPDGVLHPVTDHIHWDLRALRIICTLGSSLSRRDVHTTSRLPFQSR